MSSEDIQPGPLQTKALELQVQQCEAAEASNQALECTTEKPAEAFQLFSVAMEKWDARFRDEIAFLSMQLEKIQQILERPQGPLSPDDEAFLRQRLQELPQEIEELRRAAVNKKIPLLQGQGMVAYQLGNLAEAKVIFEQILDLLGDQLSGDRATTLMMLARIADQGEWHGIMGSHSSIEASGTPYDRAYEAFLAVEQWQSAAEAKVAAADWAYFRGQRSTFLRCLDEAIQLAKEHLLADLEHKCCIRKFSFRLTTDPTGETLQVLKDEWKQLEKKTRECKKLYIEALILGADLYVALNDLDTAEYLLQEAKKNADLVPEAQWSVMVALAGLFEEHGQIDKAIQHTEEALCIARTSSIAMQIIATLRRLIPLRAKIAASAQQQMHALRELDELGRLGARDELTLTLLQRATVYHRQQKYQEALLDSDAARHFAPTVDFRRRALMVRAATLHALERYPEALDAVLEAISLLDELLAPDTKQSFDEWQDWLNEVEVLHAAAAWLTAKLGRTREAFEWAEKGKAQSLRRQLARAKMQDDHLLKISNPTFDKLHGWLSAEACAMAMFCVTSWGTLILILEPRSSNPLAFFVNLNEEEIKNHLSLLPNTISSKGWKEVVFGAETLQALSKELLHPLQDVLQEIAQHSPTLYIVPDASLYRASFAALTFTDGTPLVKYLALSQVPSATILTWCSSRRLPQAERTCLALGVGASGGSSFDEEAIEVAKLPWKDTKTLLNEQATKQQFLEEALHYSVLHLSCHGMLEGIETLSASQLEFANKERLTAKEIFEWRGQLHADLVFLSACISAHFRSGNRSEVNGFWRAFIYAGAASIIATLITVEPEPAEHLALNFYREWLKGDVTKAEALRRTQHHMYQQGYEPHHWAAHILIGDHN
jgi:CHAT domain-containing protein/DNA-binding transcriptional MerR regulator